MTCGLQVLDVDSGSFGHGCSSVWSTGGWRGRKEVGHDAPLNRCVVASPARRFVPSVRAPYVYHANRGKYMGDGCPEAMMLAHGFSIDMMVELVNAGLATATAERAIQKSRPHRLHFFARRITRPVPRSPEILGHARSSRIFPQDPLQLLRAEIER